MKSVTSLIFVILSYAVIRHPDAQVCYPQLISLLCCKIRIRFFPIPALTLTFSRELSP